MLTISCTGSDCALSTTTATPTNFNPRSPCGERLLRVRIPGRHPIFQPTLPVRGATIHRASSSPASRISTHAPRAGSDVGGIRLYCQLVDFNPRSPCGERRGISQATERTQEFQPTLPVRGATASSGSGSQSFLFQPTLPVRGATDWLPKNARRDYISTHAPRAGSD